MTKHSMKLSDEEILSRLLTRRDVVRIGAASALVAAPVLLATPGGGHDALAQSTDGAATAETTVGPMPGEAAPAPGIPIESFMDLSLALVGGGRLDPDRGGQLLALIAADPDRLTALDELLAIRVGGATAMPIATPVAALSGSARDLVEQILRFWYLGMYDDQPVTDRAGFWFGLSAWQAVEYTYAPSVCRAFGLWAEPPPG